MTRRAMQLDPLPLDPVIDSAHERRWVNQRALLSGEAAIGPSAPRSGHHFHFERR